MKRTKHNYIQLSKKQCDILRYSQWKKQNKQCSILKQKIKYENAVLDHQHKLKHEKAGENGKGLCRGVLHFQANSFEGVVLKKYKRYGLNKYIDLITLLRNLADYLENPPIKAKYIHHSEKEKPKKLGKREYNKIKKHYFTWYPRRKTIPKYPTKGRITKEWKILLKKLEELSP